MRFMGEKTISDIIFVRPHVDLKCAARYRVIKKDGLNSYVYIS